MEACFGTARYFMNGRIIVARLRHITIGTFTHHRLDTDAITTLVFVTHRHIASIAVQPRSPPGTTITFGWIGSTTHIWSIGQTKNEVEEMLNLAPDLISKDSIMFLFKYKKAYCVSYSINNRSRLIWLSCQCQIQHERNQVIKEDSRTSVTLARRDPRSCIGKTASSCRMLPPIVLCTYCALGT